MNKGMVVVGIHFVTGTIKAKKMHNFFNSFLSTHILFWEIHTYLIYLKLLLTHDGTALKVQTFKNRAIFRQGEAQNLQRFIELSLSCDIHVFLMHP